MTRLYPLLTIAWCGVIFLASSRPDLVISESDGLDFVLRKAAHMIVFGILLLLVGLTLRTRGVAPRTTLVAAWVFTLLYAVSDEYHQTFVTGRRGSPIDVTIDMAGASIALAGLAVAARR